MESCELKTVLAGSPKMIYEHWLSSEGHSAMTGGSAEASPEVGAAFNAWDGYIWGKNLELEEDRRIVQSWRTTEFADEDEDSRLEVVLEPTGDGCQITIRHSHIPEGQTQYEQGWVDHYLEPMKSYFG